MDIFQKHVRTFQSDTPTRTHSVSVCEYWKGSLLEVEILFTPVDCNLPAKSVTLTVPKSATGCYTLRRDLTGLSDSLDAIVSYILLVENSLRASEELSATPKEQGA